MFGISVMILIKFFFALYFFVVVESPAGVGFSYSDKPAAFTDDNITALENYAFLVNWFSNFSEYKKNDFYIM